MTTEVTLSHDAARTLYDRIGSWLDTQRFYEDVPIAGLIAQGGFDAARRVFEFGVGTGRLAERLLRDHLPAAARYHALDVSAARRRAARRRRRRRWTAAGRASGRAGWRRRRRGAGRR